jgi:predicted lipid-binding transport protein (Tim44 family)
MDIIILLLCTFLIINRLMKMLGQYDPEEDKRRNERNTIIMDLMRKKYDLNANEKVINPQVISATELTLPEDLRKIIYDIKSQDINFDIDDFINKAKKAYVMYLNAIATSDNDTIKNLTDEDFFNKISIRSNAVKTKIDTIKDATLINGSLFGDRAMLTMSFTYSGFIFTEDDNGNVISGSKEKSQSRRSQVTFSRYLSQEKSWKITKEVNEK